MIAFVRGILDTVEEDRIIIDHQGMGLELLVPGSILQELPQVGNEVEIYGFQKMPCSFLDSGHERKRKCLSFLSQ